MTRATRSILVEMSTSGVSKSCPVRGDLRLVARADGAGSVYGSRGIEAAGLVPGGRSGARETAPPCASAVENPVPEASADPEIGVVVIVMRHMAHPRLVEPVARLDREMMGRVMHEHVGGVTQQHPAGESTGGDVV